MPFSMFNEIQIATGLLEQAELPLIAQIIEELDEKLKGDNFPTTLQCNLGYKTITIPVGDKNFATKLKKWLDKKREKITTKDIHNGQPYSCVI